MNRRLRRPVVRARPRHHSPRHQAANIFITTTARAKILDFWPGPRHAVRRDPDRKILGTPNYMAPEQIRGDERSTIRADIFARRRRCSYELLSGRKLAAKATPFRHALQSARKRSRKHGALQRHQAVPDAFDRENGVLAKESPYPVSDKREMLEASLQAARPARRRSSRSTLHTLLPSACGRAGRGRFVPPGHRAKRAGTLVWASPSSRKSQGITGSQLLTRPKRQPPNAVRRQPRSPRRAHSSRGQPRRRWPRPLPARQAPS